MFEGAIAAFLNRLLGKYVEDLDTEQFNVGIFSGDTCLTDLKLKPEALYQLGLPIRVEVGLIGKIVLKIPWSSLFSQPIVLCVEDVYIVAVPATYGAYDAEIQKKLIRAEKRKILEDLLEDDAYKTELMDNLLASITKNFQITINNIHVRYEEKLLNNSLCACGICIQTISVTTTNNKWKPGVCGNNTNTVYQLIRAESLSAYMDPDTESCLMGDTRHWDLSSLLSWKSTMYKSLQTFGMRNKEFQFLLKPFTARIKVIIHKGSETQNSRMLIDVVLQDVAMQVSETQYITFCELYDSLLRAVINSKHRPEKAVKEVPSAWWKYAYRSIVEFNVKPYTWKNIVEHRKNYRKYKETCIQTLQRPNDMEIKLDLQKYEDNLSILNIVIAREHAKQELRSKQIENDCQNTKGKLAKQSAVENLSPKQEKVQKNQSIDSNEQESKKSLYKIVSNGSGLKIKLEKLKRPIDYKINFTLANCCLSLLNSDREVLVITVTQLLTSIETRSALSAYKVSARAESFVIEGTSAEGDLVPLITVDNVLTGNISTNFLSIDFEKNPSDVDPLFDISVKLEALEVIYHHHAVIEIINFFKLNDADVQTTILWIYRLYDYINGKVLNLVEAIVTQTLRISFKIEIKAPYIVFPEHGSIQKGGDMIVVDFGKVTSYNQLQAPNVQLEDATLMELEELLYDRVHIIFSGCQVLCCHSGDDWRTARKKKDSEYHVVPKIQTTMTIAYSIKPEYRQLSRTRVSVSVTSLKFNLSETKLRLMMHFMNLLLVVYQRNVEKYEKDFKRCIAKKSWKGQLVTTKELAEVQRNIYLPSITTIQNKISNETIELLTNNVPKLDRSVVSSEISEEDLELLAKTINLSGFDDNVSPCNHINLLLRFVIGELSIHLSNLHHGREEPYLNLRIGTLRLEAAIMEYGPAIQFDIGSILLVDKTNAGVTGSYLELISTDEPLEVLRVSYRKVKSSCPDFKSHFKSIERSLLINILNVNLNLHRPALLNIKEYWNTLLDIFKGSPLFAFLGKVSRAVIQWTTKVEDPPIPPGAIKLNYSARLDSLALRFCDKDVDLLEVRVLGLENDCIYTANERMVLRAHLRHLLIEDLNEETLYAKILTTEEDKVFDLKYVRHMPRLYVCPEIESTKDDVMSDGTFKFSVGRINCVLITKILQDLRHFLAPFTHNYCTRLKDWLNKMFISGIEEFKRSASKLHVFIDIQGPIFLLPQRKDVPTLLVFNTGTLSVENFFKKVDQPNQAHPNKASGNETSHLIIDNILVKLNNMGVSRAIMMLNRDLEIQEPIIEPIHIHFDIKRKTEYRSVMEYQTYGLFNIQGSVDFVNINLSQKDLKTSILVWKDNISKLLASRDCFEGDDHLPSEEECAKLHSDDHMVKKLEDFLAHNETAVCEVNTKLTLEGLQLNLFLDSEEVLSSPVRDLNHGLCKLTFGEVISTLAFYSDRSLKMKLSLQNCVLQDTRKSSRLIKKIIQSPAKLIGMNPESCISVSMSPIVDIAFTRAPGGEKCVDALIQEVRINLSVPFAMHLTRYILDSLPGDQIDEGIVNRAYECTHQTSRNITSAERDKLKYARYFKEEPDASVSIRIHKPEILLFGEMKGTDSQVVLVQAEIAIESSRHNCSSSIVCTLSNVRAKCKKRENYLRQPPYWLLCPCDIEICRKEEGPDFNVNYNVNINTIDLHLSMGIIHTFINILSEATSFLESLYIKPEGAIPDMESNMHVNLWTPKKIVNVPYKKLDDNDSDLFNVRGDKIVTITVKPVLVSMLLEMEYFIERVPVIKTECVLSSVVNDWYNNFNMESNIKMYAFCYNMDYKSWEPLIDLCTEDDMQYKPWELTIKMRHGEAFMINSNWTDPRLYVKQDSCQSKKKNIKSIEQDSMDMVFITPDNMNVPKTTETELYSTYDEDSDTDDEEGHKKLSRTANCLFQDNSSEDEESDSDVSSSNEDEVMEAMLECNIDSFGQVGRESIKSNDLCTYITISSEDKLNFVITPNTISMLDTMVNAFLQTKGGIPIMPTSIKKLNLHNEIGHAGRIQLRTTERVNEKNVSKVIAVRDYCKGSPPVTPQSSPEPEEHTGPSSPQLIENEIDFADPRSDLQNHTMLIEETLKDDSPVDVYKTVTGEILDIILDGFEDVHVCCPKRRGCNVVPLRPVRHEVRYHLVIEATIDKHLHRSISVRSPLQFRNETSYALGLYYKKSLLDKFGLSCIGEPANPFDDNIRMAIIEPDSVYSIPLYIAYHFPIHILPTYLGDYRVSSEGIFWKDLCTGNNSTKDIQCKSKSEQDQSIFCVKVSCTETELSTRPSCHVPNYLISIHPPLILNNQLPFVVDINVPSIEYEVKIEPGERINIHTLTSEADIQFIFKIPNYLGAYWTGSAKLNANLEKKFVQMSTDSSSELTTPFYLCVELCKHTSWHIVIRAQYWILNKSRLPLYLQACDTLTTYEIPADEFMVFAQKNNKKSMVRLRAHQSEWSQQFGMEGITSASMIVCKDAERRRKYKILTEIENSRLSPHFTKIIKFLPSFVVYNKTKRTLRFMEENDQADLWYYLAPGEDMSFWPVTESMKMRIKWKNSQLVSQHFDMTQTGKTVLRMDNGTAVCVQIEGGRNMPYYITFQKYTAGDIPVRIDNLCEELFLKVSQSNLGQVALVNPFQSLLYTWDDPTKPRELIWNIYNNKRSGYKAEFEKDGSGEELVPFVIVERRDGTVSKPLVNTKSWSEERSTSTESNIHDDESKSSKLDLQKDRTVVYWVSYMEGSQRVLLFAQHESVYLKAKGIIDPEPSRREFFLSLAGISASIVSNECRKFPKELIYANVTNSAAHWELYFGKKWKSLSLELSAWLESKYGNSIKRAQLDNFLDVDLLKMQMTKPFFGKLRRTYSPAIWLHWRTSLTLNYLQGYVHRIQVDNQLNKATFPVIMYSNLQKSFTDHAGNRKLKHCIEFASLKQRKLKHDIYKGVCLIIRELNVNLQEKLLLSLIDLMPKRHETKHTIAAKLRSDVSLVHGVSMNKSTTDVANKRKDIIENIYISPILIRLQLLADTDGPNIYNISDVSDYRNVIRFIFEYGEKGGLEKHAEFKFPFYQCQYVTADNKQLVSELLRSYTAQAMQQFHVLIRSTTVLGNQYGYNFKSPGSYFYDPDSLLLYGDEIAEKLTHEVMCQLGYTTTDSMQITMLNFNNVELTIFQLKGKESSYQNKSMPPEPSNQNFSIEIETGTSSLLTALTNNVHQEELKYVLKTLGKKTSVLFKGESSSLKTTQVIADIIKRAQEIGHKFICRIRLPRYVNPYKGVEVFSTHKAKGMHLLSTLNKNHSTDMDTYWAHTCLSHDGKCIALVSLERLYFIEKGNTWGSWNVRWSLEIEQLLSPPTVVNNKLILHVNKDEKASSNVVDWYLESEATDVLEWLCQKINIAMILNMENSICSEEDL